MVSVINPCGPALYDKSIDNCLLPEPVPPIESSGINHVYQASPLTVPAVILVVTKLYCKIALLNES